MNFNEQMDFIKELKKLAVHFRQDPDKIITSYWWNALNTFSLEDIKRALDNWAITKTKWPLPADIKDFLKVCSAKPRRKIAERSLDIQQKIDELEAEFTLVCKQICANGVNFGLLNQLPGLKKLLEKDSKVADELVKDYSMYKTTLTNEQLYDKRRQIETEISDLISGAKGVAI